MDSLDSDVCKLKEIVQLLHSEMKLMQTEITDLKQHLRQHIDEVYNEMDELAEKLTTDIQSAKNTSDQKTNELYELVSDVN